MVPSFAIPMGPHGLHWKPRDPFVVLIKVPSFAIPMGSHGLHWKAWDPMVVLIKVPSSAIPMGSYGLYWKTWVPIGIANEGTLTFWRRNYFFNFSTFCI